MLAKFAAQAQASGLMPLLKAVAARAGLEIPSGPADLPVDLPEAPLS